MTDICHIVRRGNFYDVFLNGNHRGSGTWAWRHTAVYFYRLEGFQVEVVE